MKLHPASQAIIETAVNSTVAALTTYPFTDDAAAQGLIEINARNVFRLVAAARRDLDEAEHAEAVFCQALARLSQPQQAHANS